MADFEAGPSRSSRDHNQKDCSYTDFMCPICLQLLIEPVVMPCKHELCMPCFKTHVESTSLCCPMCRVRISSWARRKAREGTLMDQRRWETIQRLFPERCRKRLNGDDDDEDDEYFVSTGKVSLRARKGPAWGAGLVT